MVWTIEISAKAKKELSKIDRAWALKIKNYLVDVSSDPRRKGKPLSGNKKGFWRYRVGDFRVLCRIEDERLVVLVVNIGHRRAIYKKVSR